MRTPLTLLGTAVIIAYSFLGAMLMNNWVVVAASGMPLDSTSAELSTAGQPLDTVGGVVFAAIGTMLALAWCTATLLSRATVPGWAAFVTWCAIVALGAPAYFFGAFANLNSVGDVFVDWDRDAALALEAPLYIVSGIAAFLAVATLITVGIRAVARSRSTPSPLTEVAARV